MTKPTFEEWYANVKQNYLNSVQMFLEDGEYERTGIFELVGTTAEEQAEKMARNDFESNEFNASTLFRFNRTTGFFEHHKAEFVKRAVEMLKKAYPNAEFTTEMINDNQGVIALLTGHVSVDEFISNNSELTSAMIGAIGNQCFDEADILNRVDKIWLMAIGRYSAVSYEIMSHYKPDEIYQLAKTIINNELNELDEGQHLTTQVLTQRIYNVFAEEAFGYNWRDYINVDQGIVAVRPLIMKPNEVYNAISDQVSDYCSYDLASLGINQIPKELEETLWEQVVDELNDADTIDFFIETLDEITETMELDLDIEEWLDDELSERTAEMFEELDQRYKYEYEGETATLDDLISDCYINRLPIDDLVDLIAGTISPDEYLEDLGYRKVD